MAGIDPKRRALGRGLESLLPSKPAVAAPVAVEVPVIQAAVEESTGRPLEIELGAIDRNPYQTRMNFDREKLEELTQSVRAHGVMQPVVVRPVSEGKYQLITGERRLLASYKAEKKTIPAIVRVVSDEQALEMTIVENLQRADLGPMEQAQAFQRLSSEFKMTQEQISLRTGLGRSAVANYMRLNKLPEEIQEWIAAGKLSFGHAKLLAGLPNAAGMLFAAKKAVDQAMSVRQFEEWISAALNPELKVPKPKFEVPRDANVYEAEGRLQRALGLRVRVEDKGGRGRVVIDYGNLEDFDSLMAALGAQG